MTRPSAMSVTRALVWFAAAYGLALVGYLVINAVSSRWLGTAEYGYFVIAVTTSLVIGQLGLLGAHRGGLREAAVMGETDDPERLARLRSDVRVALLLTIPVAAAISGVVISLITGDTTATRIVAGAGFAALVWLGGVQKLWANLLRGLGAIKFASLLEGRSGGGLVACGQAVALLLVWLLLPDTGLTGALAAMAVGFAGPVLIAGVMVHRRWAHVPGRTPLWSGARDSVRRNWRFAINQFAVYAGMTVELWVAGLVFGEVDASHYAAAQRLSLLLAIPMTAVQVVFAPVAARMLDQGRTEDLQAVLRTGATAAGVVTSFVWIPMLIAPGAVLALVLGEPFRGAAAPLVVLTLGGLANVVVGLAGTALTMSHREGVVAAVQTGSVVARIACGFTAAILWGPVGLAASAALVAAATYGLMWWQAKRLLGVRTDVTLRPRLSLLGRTSA
jgi:O-antigen/teichoic acid export membrane protein